jgi:ATP-dependent exoDNAse (exonuclease V) alpha subunit
VAAAAYRAADCLYDERLGQTWDYTRKQGVRHAEILAPGGVPAWIYNRERLWNVTETIEQRKDAQLAREIEIALPRELNAEAQITLLRDFVQREFVSKGMVADCSLHRDNLENPHAHILLTLRRVGENGFGLKERSWNSRSNLSMWRIGWEEVANEHLARAGLAIRIDHRTLEAQEIDLIPGRKIGISLDRQQDPTLPRRIAERVEEQRRIASQNGESILADPSIALRALTHQQATFTKHDIARFLNTRTDGAEQFQAALLKVTTSPDLVALGHDERGQQRYTSREMLEIEEGMLHRADLMTLRRRHGTSPVLNRASFVAGTLSSEQPDDVRQLDEVAREVRRERGELGHAEHIDKIFMDLIDAQQQAAAERWQEKQRAQELGVSAHEQQRSADLDEHLDVPQDNPPAQRNRPDLSLDGLEDDLEL